MTTIRICETCRRVVDPEDADVVSAHELADASSLAGPAVVEGLVVHFHDRCFPRGSRRYRRITA